jgi:hypothetical protein
MTASVTRRVLLDVQASLPARKHQSYVNHTFKVPRGATRVGVILYFNNAGGSFIVPTLFAPDGYRGSRPNPFSRGDIRLEMITGPDEASHGMIPGQVLPGEWQIRFDLAYMRVDTPYHLEAWADFTPVNGSKPDE